jgi:hypothetical protein
MEWFCMECMFMAIACTTALLYAREADGTLIGLRRLLHIPRSVVTRW